VALSAAEIACRGISVAVTLFLAKTLGAAGFGRIEFAFNIVFWLVLLVREGLDIIAAREIARHPRLVRPMVNHILAIRGTLALSLLSGLLLVGYATLSDFTDRLILSLYGLLLLTTACGLDYVYRGLERMWLVAISLAIRTSIYAVGVALLVFRPEQALWVPVCLVTGELSGIALVWWVYTRRYGWPRPSLRGSRRLTVFVNRGRPIYLIQVSQAVIGSTDLLVVGLMSLWADVGRYGAPHRMVTAILTFGLIFQQVVFPSLARSWRADPTEGRRALNALVRVLVLGLVPITVGVMILSAPLVKFLLPPEYAEAGLLLALGIWRAPLLTLAYLYQTSLIALNREAAGVKLLLAGALGAGPLVAVFRWSFGLPGAAVAVILTGLALVIAGHCRLAQEGRAPVWHYHLGKPLLAAAPMAAVCCTLRQGPVLVSVLVGATTYGMALGALGGLKRSDLKTIFGRA
jgi:O-antigen/teichoic acid export membrane protein